VSSAFLGLSKPKRCRFLVKNSETEISRWRAPISTAETVASGCDVRGLGCCGSGFLARVAILSLDEALLARMIHERFCCSPVALDEQRVPGIRCWGTHCIPGAMGLGLHATPAACRRAGSPLSPSTYCFKYASVPLGSSLTHCNEKSNGSPSHATAGYPLLLRNARGGRHEPP